MRKDRPMGRWPLAFNSAMAGAPKKAWIGEGRKLGTQRVYWSDFCCAAKREGRHPEGMKGMVVEEADGHWVVWERTYDAVMAEMLAASLGTETKIEEKHQS